MDKKSGYKNPPKSTRFQKGASGNPNGRPKGKELNIIELLKKVLSEDITIQENGTEKVVMKAEAYFKRTVNSALNGDHSSANRLQKLFPFISEGKKDSNEITEIRRIIVDPKKLDSKEDEEE